MGAARNGCKTLPWQVRVGSGWKVDRDWGVDHADGMVYSMDIITEVKMSQRTFSSHPLNKKERDPTTHVLTGITNFGT